MSINTQHKSISGFISHYRISPTDGSVNAKNIAHAQESMSRIKINKEKLYLMRQKEDRDQKLFENRDKLDNIKIQRDALQLRKEAKEYWESLSDEEKEQYFLDQKGKEYVEAAKIAHQQELELRAQDMELEKQKAELHKKNLKEERKNQITKTILKILPWYLLASALFVIIYFIIFAISH